MVAIATVAAFALMTLALGLLLAFVPYLTRKNECFAVTVPASAQTDPRVAAFKKRYASIMVVATVAFAAVATAGGACLAQSPARASDLGVALECAAVFGPVVLSFSLMLAFRRKVLALKQAEGWAAGRSVRAAVDEEDAPRPIPLAWNFAYVVLILLTAAIGLALYPSMPDLIPMHGDFAGNVDSYAEKSIASVFGFPLLMELFLALLFLGCHAIMIHSKRPTDPGAPATSALAYGLFARAQSIFLLIVGIAIAGGIGIGFMLSSAGVITLAQFGAAMAVAGILVVVCSIAISVVYGQAGSRLFKRMQGSDLLPDNDDDAHWKLGVLYFNPDDASVFLPERFGFGWTINFARPAAWILVGCFVAVDGLAVAAAMLLA